MEVHMILRTSALCISLGALMFAGCASVAAQGTPRYDHIFIIIAENHASQQIIGNSDAPNLNRLATTYGLATNFYGEAHPSQPNYIAILGGDTFGIHDDEAWYCKAGSTDRHCPTAGTASHYPDHTVTARSLIDQLAEHHLTWKGYFESIPVAGSKAVAYPESPTAGQPEQLYASKHNGFLSYKTAQDDPNLFLKLVGFDQLMQDLATGRLPNYAHIVPNQCHEMHGLGGANVPDSCRFENERGRIVRADLFIGELVANIMDSPAWSAPGNSAIVVTWDEDNTPKEKTEPQGCCGFDPQSEANFGGGHIPTIVITNHGPRGVKDDTPYNHYSLLRTTEEAFGIDEFLGHANDTAAGVKSMSPLFQVP
jgi:hypothetical protein